MSEQKNVMMHIWKREIKESRACLGPKEPVAHGVPLVPMEFLEVLDRQGLASEDLPDGQA